MAQHPASTLDSPGDAADAGWPAELCLAPDGYTVFFPGQESDSRQLTRQSRVSSMPWGQLWEASLQLRSCSRGKDWRRQRCAFPTSTGEPARTPFLLQPNWV